MNKKIYKKIVIGLLSLLGSSHALAEDALSALMQAMKSNKITQVDYQETRHLALMDKPWQGSGYLYALSPDLMIREQQQPQRLLMGIKGKDMLYFDPVADTRQQTELDMDDESNITVAALTALINSDETLLRELFQVEFISATNAWTMSLTPKSADTAIHLKISGLPSQPANKILITQANGDTSEYTLLNNRHEHSITTTINQLYHELLGE